MQCSRRLRGLCTASQVVQHHAKLCEKRTFRARAQIVPIVLQSLEGFELRDDLEAILACQFLLQIDFIVTALKYTLRVANRNSFSRLASFEPGHRDHLFVVRGDTNG